MNLREEISQFKPAPHTEEASVAVQIKQLSLSFSLQRSKEPLRVLDAINLEIRNSEFISIVGPSGCGKTSMLKIIGGIIKSDDANAELLGTVTVDGVTTVQAKAARLFGFAFQNPVLLPWRTVRDNVELPLEIAGYSGPDKTSRVSDLLELMDIRGFAQSYPHELSGGMQQRVNIARALVHQPKILLMDEPFGALDEITREKLNLALYELHRVKRTTIVFVTHSLREAVFLSNRILILSKRPAKVKALLDSPLALKRDENTQSGKPYLDFLSQVRNVLFQEEQKK